MLSGTMPSHLWVTLTFILFLFGFSSEPANATHLALTGPYEIDDVRVSRALYRLGEHLRIALYPFLKNHRYTYSFSNGLVLEYYGDNTCWSTDLNDKAARLNPFLQTGDPSHIPLKTEHLMLGAFTYRGVRVQITSDDLKKDLFNLTLSTQDQAPLVLKGVHRRYLLILAFKIIDGVRSSSLLINRDHDSLMQGIQRIKAAQIDIIRALLKSEAQDNHLKAEIFQTILRNLEALEKNWFLRRFRPARAMGFLAQLYLEFESYMQTLVPNSPIVSLEDPQNGDFVSFISSDETPFTNLILKTLRHDLIHSKILEFYDLNQNADIQLSCNPLEVVSSITPVTGVGVNRFRAILSFKVGHAVVKSWPLDFLYKTSSPVHNIAAQINDLKDRFLEEYNNKIQSELNPHFHKSEEIGVRVEVGQDLPLREKPHCSDLLTKDEEWLLKPHDLSRPQKP